MLKKFTIEYRINPIGLDEKPRFSWKIHSEEQNTLQVAYQIIVTEGKREVWNSEKIASEQSVLVSYQGEALKPMAVYEVRVQVWDNHGEISEAAGSFEMGLINQKNWKAQWITHNLAKGEDLIPIFTKKINLSGKAIKRARAYATSCGVYDLFINGEKAGDAFLAPGWTAYKKRLQYQTYDVTKLFCNGMNEVAVPVGNGWYKGFLNGEGENCFYGDRVAFMAMLYFEMEDGTVEVIGTDTDWKYKTGLIRSSEIYHGEAQDFTVKESVEKPAVLFDASEKVTNIVAQEVAPVRITKRFPVKEKIITPRGELVLDFGQNMAALVEVRLPELAGDRLIIRHAETLDKEGNFYMENLRTAKCTDTYIYGLNEVDKVVLPHFTYHGFRYVCVEGVSEEVDISRFTACVLHTDMEKTGTFFCSNQMINQLQSNIEWTQRSNFVDIPTDCPQRDERLGWTGDALIFSSTAGFNFDTALFFTKWLRDLKAESSPQTGVPHMVPNIVGGGVGTAVWSDSATVIPWTMYRIYGDVKFLEEQYDNMKNWVEYIRRSAGDNVLWQNGFQRGDWLSLDGEEGTKTNYGGTDRHLVANVFYAYSTSIVCDAASVLKRTEDVKEYSELYANIVETLNKEYVTGTGRLVTETQSACSLLLHFDLISKEHRGRVIKLLEDNLAAHKGHLTTGFIGTGYLCHALTENGKHNLAEEVLLQEDYPSWLYAIKMGATTIWERWNSILPNGDFDTSGMNSLNHYSYGSIGDWLYKKIAGINIVEPGYKKILIKPTLTHTMQQVKATLETVYGTVESSYTCENGKITVDVVIPANTTAVLILPEREGEIALGSGSYHYEYPTETSLERSKYNMNSTLGEILADETGKQILSMVMPGMAENPMMTALKNKTLSDFMKMAHLQKTIFDDLLKQLNHKS